METCKLNGVDPQGYLAVLLTRLVNGWPNSRIDELMPWNWALTKSCNRATVPGRDSVARKRHPRLFADPIGTPLDRLGRGG